MEKICLKIIRFYQNRISVLFRANNPYRGCRFYPSCSDYCVQAIEKYGFFKGTIKSAKRILKCNPFNKGGVDIC